MSRWTHVAGIVRLDQFPFTMQGSVSEEQFRRLIEVRSPIGSEGGLDFFVRKTQEVKENGAPMSWGGVAFMGDLRDFDSEDVQKIETWLKETTERIYEMRTAMIRQGVVTVEVESEEKPRVYLFDCDARQWMRDPNV